MNLKSSLKIATLAAAMAGGAVSAQSVQWDPRTGDVWVDQQISAYDRYGPTTQDAFVDNLVRRYGVDRSWAVGALNNGVSAGDLSYACALARTTGRTCAAVVAERLSTQGAFRDLDRDGIDDRQDRFVDSDRDGINDREDRFIDRDGDGIADRNEATSQKRGWGALAQSYGIKPGSPEFHRLKEEMRQNDWRAARLDTESNRTDRIEDRADRAQKQVHKANHKAQKAKHKAKKSKHGKQGHGKGKH